MSKYFFTRRQFKRYKNPFSRPRQDKTLSKRIKINIILLAFCVITWVYFIFFSPLFIFKEVDIQIDDTFREKDLVRETIKNYFDNAYFFSLYKKNYFFFNEEKLKENLKEYFFVKDVKAERSFPNRLTISVERIKPRFVLNLPYETFYLDENGVILEKYLNSSVPKSNLETVLPSILVSQDIELNIQNKMFSEEILAFIDKFYYLFHNQQSNLKINFFEAKDVKQIQGSLKAFINPVKENFSKETKNNGYLYLNTNLAPEFQLENFLAVYKEKIQPQNKQFEYVDLRFGDKVYLKL